MITINCIDRIVTKTFAALVGYNMKCNHNLNIQFRLKKFAKSAWLGEIFSQSQFGELPSQTLLETQKSDQIWILIHLDHQLYTAGSVMIV